MDVRNRLFLRIVIPLALLGVTVGAVILVSFTVLQNKLHQDELQTQADIVASSIESSAEIFATGQELMDYVAALGGDSFQLSELALIEPGQKRVVAATQDAWIGRNAMSVPTIAAALDPGGWRDLDESRVGFKNRVIVKNASLSRVYGEQLDAIILLSDEKMASHQSEAMNRILLMAVVGAGTILLAAFSLVQKHVLHPLRGINTAVDQHRNRMAEGEHRPLRLPRMQEDEIGELARVLKRSFSELAETQERARVLSTAVDRSSNEVYIMSVKELKFTYANDAALQNLGHSLDELVGMPAASVAPDLANDQVLAELGKQLAQNAEISHTYRHVRKDGSSYRYEFKSMQVVADEDLMITVGSDVTERILQEQKLAESEERMAMALSGSKDGLFDYVLDKDQIYVSDSVQTWLNLNQDHLHVNQLFPLLHQDDANLVIESFRGAIQNQSSLNVEFRLHDQLFKQLRWLALRGQVIKKGDQVVRLSGFVSDVTHRKVAEDLINTTVTRLGAVLNNIADGILTLSGDGKVCTVNPAGAAMLGRGEMGLAGTPVFELIPPENRQQVQSWMNAADGCVHETVMMCADGRAFPAEIAIASMDAVVDERYTVVLRDVTERKEHEASLQQALDEAQNATRAKAEFLATMSHEIRTPMNGVLGMTQLLLGMELGPDQREAAQLIFSSGDALLNLINDILDFSKIEAGRIELEELAFDLHAAIREVVELLATTARSKSLDLYVDYQSDIESALVGDVGRLRQVLLNLLGNAVKFTEEGHVVVRVRVSAIDDQSARVQIAIVDTGVGISQEAQSRLFESFTQADASTTRRFGGTGLGLAISKQLVELMGGEISVTSAPEEGSQFAIEMALGTADVALVESTEGFHALNNKRVLIVDDNQVGLKIASSMTRDFGMNTQTTDDPEAVLPLLAAAHELEQPTELLVLDYNMPGMDGLSVATAVRADARFDACKIVLLTSSDIEKPSGIDGYGLKPYFRNGLAKLLCQALEVDDVSNVPVEPSSASPSLVGEGLKILVAEDNPVNQKVATRMLEKLGATADVAANGVEAVDMWHQFEYDLIFMDCQMPEMDGYGATSQIRAFEKESGRRPTPIIAMTANALAGDRENCLAAGMDDYASKPIKLDQLGQLITIWTQPGLSTGSGMDNPDVRT
ncbi:MAG: response regulator [Pseudomonadota bacterium]